jgi:hypothetical protein
VKTESHHDADWVIERLAFTCEGQMNYLLNIGPLPDGSVFPADENTLRGVGRRIREHGWPKGAQSLPAAKGEQEAF